MTNRDVGECDACGVTTHGEFCRACDDRVDDASKAFAESVAKAVAARDDDTTAE